MYLTSWWLTNSEHASRRLRSKPHQFQSEPDSFTTNCMMAIMVSSACANHGAVLNWPSELTKNIAVYWDGCASCNISTAWNTVPLIYFGNNFVQGLLKVHLHLLLQRNQADLLNHRHHHPQARSQVSVNWIYFLIQLNLPSVFVCNSSIFF